MFWKSKESCHNKIMYEVGTMDTWALRLESMYENGDSGRPENAISCAKRILNHHMKDLKDLLSIYKTL